MYPAYAEGCEALESHPCYPKFIGLGQKGQQDLTVQQTSKHILQYPYAAYSVRISIL